MARPLRIQIPDGWYHVTARGTERRAILTDEACYRHFLDLLEEMTGRYRVKVHAYVLMPNHVHVVLSTPEANLSAAMQWLKTSYSMWFNRKEGRVGPGPSAVRAEEVGRADAERGGEERGDCALPDGGAGDPSPGPAAKEGQDFPPPTSRGRQLYKNTDLTPFGGRVQEADNCIKIQT